MTAQTAITARTETSPPIRWSEPSLPAKLDALLEENRSFTDLPVVGPVSAAHLREYVASCQPPMPAREQIERMIGRIAVMMPSPKLTDKEAAERLSLYGRALSVHALPDLHAAFDVIVRTCRFFPTVAEIEAIIAPIKGRRTRREGTARMILLKHEREWSEPQENLTADEAQLLGSILADPMGKNEGASA
ncbi:hypothetical protein [Sphingobium agri]|uniref:Uncharacterized protein n=1 Tax=Sphingobium agri TaxID=2933566 RepID=A0ABT0DWI9_9SPHN|nr:hypothetical protein [Sphingobium agri]MCK0531466.1 hypothetical protein [Sphingobium agri]